MTKVHSGKKILPKAEPLSRAHEHQGQTDDRQTDFRQEIPECHVVTFGLEYALCVVYLVQFLSY